MEGFNSRETQEALEPLEAQTNLLSIDITQEAIKQSYGRIRAVFDTAYNTPQIDKPYTGLDANPIQDLVDTKKSVLEAQSAVNIAQQKRNENLKRYQDQKVVVENLITEMSAKQTKIKALAAKDPLQSNTLRGEFTATQKSYDESIKQLATYNKALGISYPALQSALTTLAQSKQTYANTVIASRKKHWDMIIAWNQSGLGTYRGDLDKQQTDIKGKLDSNTSNTSVKVGADEIKKREKKRVVKELGSNTIQEKDLRSQYFDKVYDSALYDAVSDNKSIYQISYLTQLKSIMRSDLEFAKMSGSTIVSELVRAKESILQPSSNNKPITGATSAEGYQFPVFDYGSYQSAVFALEDTKIDELDTTISKWAINNQAITAFQETLNLSSEEKAIIAQQPNFEANMQSQVYTNLVGLMSDKTTDQAKGKDILKEDTDLSKLSISGRLLIYRNTLKQGYDKLNDEHLRLQGLLTSGEVLTATQVAKIGKGIADIRALRKEISQFVIFKPKSDIADLTKGDQTSGLLPQFDIMGLLSKIPTSDIALKSISDQPYSPQQLERKMGGDGSQPTVFTYINLPNNILSYEIITKEPQKYTTQMTYAWEEEMNTLTLGFEPLKSSIAALLQNIAQIKIN